MRPNNKTERLSDKEIKKLKYDLRPGIVFGIFLGLPSLILLIVGLNTTKIDSRLEMIAGGALVFSFFLTWLINRNILKDIRLGMKEITYGKVTKKISEIDYEAGSSVGYSTSGKERPWYLGMKGREKYYIGLDRIKHNVEKDFWDSIEEGEEIEIHRTRYSDKLLSFNKKRD